MAGHAVIDPWIRLQWVHENNIDNPAAAAAILPTLTLPTIRNGDGNDHDGNHNNNTSGGPVFSGVADPAADNETTASGVIRNTTTLPTSTTN